MNPTKNAPPTPLSYALRDAEVCWKRCAELSMSLHCHAYAVDVRVLARVLHWSGSGR